MRSIFFLILSKKIRPFSLHFTAYSAKLLRVVCRFSPTKNLRSGIAVSANRRSNSILRKRRDPSARKRSAAAEGARRRDGRRRRIKTSKITWIIARNTIALTVPNGTSNTSIYTRIICANPSYQIEWIPLTVHIKLGQKNTQPLSSILNILLPTPP